jgi:hypothetical protein
VSKKPESRTSRENENGKKDVALKMINSEQFECRVAANTSGRLAQRVQIAGETTQWKG